MTDEREERIRRRAHEIWEAEGRPEGRHDEHWDQATREVDGGSEAAQMASMEGVSADPSQGTKGRRRGASPAAGGQTAGQGRRARAAESTAADARGDAAPGGTTSRGRRSGPREATSEGTKPDGAPPSGRRRSAKAAGAEGGESGGEAATAAGGSRRKSASAAPTEGATEGAAPKRTRRSAKNAAADQ